MNYSRNWECFGQSCVNRAETVHGTLRFLYLSQLLYGICVKILNYESVYFKELHNQQEYYWPTIYRAGAAVVSTITSLISRRDGENNGFLAGVPLLPPPSRVVSPKREPVHRLVVSHPNSLSPFAFERLQRRLSVDCRQRTGTRTSVLAGKRKLKMQSVGRSTMTLDVNIHVKLWCSFATKVFFATASFKIMQDLIFKLYV